MTECTLIVAAIILLSCSSRAYGQSYNAYSFSTYIVREPPGGMPAPFATRRDWYLSILTSIADRNASGIHVEQRLLYTYDAVFPGFAAVLNYAEWRQMFSLAGGAVFADDVATIQTTRTPIFLGLTSGRRYSAGAELWTAANRGNDVIVGVLDTGIWPERRSFNGKGYGDPPARWKGTCQPSVPCNGKIIGSRAFFTGYDYSTGYGYAGQLNDTLESRSPRDTVGHGTHTASLIAGNPVANASLLGAAAGTAAGMAPLARLAIYKVCWDPEGTSCYTSDILAGFDAAIADGVDVISSPVATYSWEYQSNAISLGAFAAGLRGIATIAPASNNGLGTNGGVQNQAPWVMTVGASTVDRSFTAPVMLGDGRRFWGQTLYAGDGLGSDQISVVYAGSNSSLASGIPPDYAWEAAYCTNPNIYSRSEMTGKVVLCQMGNGDNFIKSRALLSVGAVGMIVMQYYNNDTTAAIEFGPPLLPTTLVTYATGQAIIEYANASFDPTVAIDFQGTVVGATPAPAVASFSAKGPNAVTAEILKPDILAPGVNILGAFTGFRGPAGTEDSRRVDFNIMSGTSASSAHAAGVAALLKAVYPEWSPAAIKSAIMTSAGTQDNTGRPISDVNTKRPATALAMGAGQINPNSALNPGFVYDIEPADYLNFLCSVNYSTAAIYTFIANSGQMASNFSCEFSPRLRPGDLNYPAFGVVYNQARAPPDSLFNTTFSRVVTNVGPSEANYSVSVVTPGSYVSVTVDPPELKFTAAGQKLSYSVTFQARPLEFSAEFSNVRVFTFGSLSWTDQIRHTTVRSPILFIWVYG